MVVLPSARESFRLPKLMVAEILALVSLVPLAWRLLGVERLDWRSVLRSPPVAAVLPFVLWASGGLLFSPHPEAVREGVIDLWVGAAALVGWSLGLSRDRLRRLLGALAVPALVLAVVALLQFFELYQPFTLRGGGEETRRGVISLVGNAGDLGGFLALALVVVQVQLLRAVGWRRLGPGVVLVLGAAALAASQTLAAMTAAVVAATVVWGVVLPRRSRLLLLGAVGGVAVLALLVLPPLQQRVVQIAGSVARGDLNAALSGRLDGFRAALHLAAEHPWAGVGHGAFGASYGAAKLELVAAGESFFLGQETTMFQNAHNELLEVLADTGVPGLLALLWGVGIVVRQLLRRARGSAAPAPARLDLALEAGALTALAVLALAHFPFRIAVTAYPAILVLAFVLAPEEPP